MGSHGVAAWRRGLQPGRVGCSLRAWGRSRGQKQRNPTGVPSNADCGRRTASTKRCQMALWYSSRWHAHGSSPTW